VKLGFIGTGSMGSMLVRAWIRSRAVQPEDILICNRTPEKAHRLVAEFPGLHLAHRPAELTARADWIWLCIKPLDYRAVLEEIASVVQPEQQILSITSPVMLSDLERWLQCKVGKVIPSISNETLAGTSLYIPGTRMNRQDVDALHNLLEAISVPLRVEEAHTRIVSDLSSCGPAFLACLLRMMTDEAVAKTGLDHQTATAIVTRMVHSVGLLLTSEGWTPDELERRVAVPGGITEHGLNVLRTECRDAFARLFDATHEKFNEDVEKVKRSLKGELK
jgi:competence protein ComER